jgi:hypothetical protein
VKLKKNFRVQQKKFNFLLLLLLKANQRIRVCSQVKRKRKPVHLIRKASKFCKKFKILKIQPSFYNQLKNSLGYLKLYPFVSVEKLEENSQVKKYFLPFTRFPSILLQCN